MSLAFIGLLWAIYANAQLGDAYGALVLAIACAFISGVSVYVITTELRDIQSRKTRKTLNKYHTQQVNELSDAIVKLETQLRNANETQRDTVARFAHARQLLAETGLDLVEHEQADAYTDKLHTLNHALWAFGYAMVEDSDLLNGAWDTLRGIDATQLTPTQKAEAFAEYVLFIYSDEPEFTITTPAKLDYTYSASTAFMVGTLDKAYLVGNETRYPLA
jgi:hypothetical protein